VTHIPITIDGTVAIDQLDVTSLLTLTTQPRHSGNIGVIWSV